MGLLVQISKYMDTHNSLDLSLYSACGYYVCECVGTMSCHMQDQSPGRGEGWAGWTGYLSNLAGFL